MACHIETTPAKDTYPFEIDKRGKVIFEKENVEAFLEWMLSKWKDTRDGKRRKDWQPIAKYYIDCIVSILISLGMEDK